MDQQLRMRTSSNMSRAPSPGHESLASKLSARMRRVGGLAVQGTGGQLAVLVRRCCQLAVQGRPLAIRWLSGLSLALVVATSSSSLYTQPLATPESKGWGGGAFLTMFTADRFCKFHTAPTQDYALVWHFSFCTEYHSIIL